MAATVTAYSSVFKQQGLAGQGMDPQRQVYNFGPFQAAGLADGYYPLFILPEDVDIEQINLRAATLAAADTDLISVGYAPSGTAKASMTDLTDTVALTNAGSGMVANTTMSVPEKTAGAFQNIPAGSLICIQTEGTIASLVDLEIQIITRPRATRVSDGGVPLFHHR